MNDNNTGFTALTSTLSYEIDEGSPASENHCQYNCLSLNLKNGCEDNSIEISNIGSKPSNKQPSNSGADNLEENESVVTAHFVSNGYYGFQPLTLAMVTEVDCQMDVGDLNAVEGAEGSSCHETIANGTSFEPYRWQSQLIGNNSPRKSFTVLGKRNWDGVTEIHTEVKRIRQEEPASLTVCLFKGVDCPKMPVDFNETPFSQRNVDCHYPRCNISQYV